MKLMLISLLITIVGGVFAVHYSKIVSENKTKQFWKKVGLIAYIIFFIFSFFYNGHKVFIALEITSLIDTLRLILFILYIMLIISFGTSSMIKKLSYEKIILKNSESIKMISELQNINIEQVKRISEILEKHAGFSKDIAEILKEDYKKELLEND